MQASFNEKSIASHRTNVSQVIYTDMWPFGSHTKYVLTWQSAIFQLYSDGTVFHFPNLDLLLGNHAMGRESFMCQAYPDMGNRTSEVAFYLLAVDGPARNEGTNEGTRGI